ncbi:MAG: ABC-2 transporter permease [Lachnospiraceae bacterium]|nr:ABC-2 transporter permease [Lachnospiraceae bacterium]MCM1237184.1 ABC-2 transporter permease [Ruminococcus flavefaciens]
MRGLLKNNFFTVWANAKVFSIFMLVWGILVVIVPYDTLQMWYILIGIVGFSVNAVSGIGNEYTSKWGKYKLTLPVKRADIVKSLFLSQIIWLLVGLLFSGIGITLSFLLHGYSYDQLIGMLSMFALGICVSFFMGAMFIPLLYLGGEEKSIVFLIITLLCSFSIASILFNITDAAPLLGIALSIFCSVLLFALSYPVTVSIYRKKEY